MGEQVDGLALVEELAKKSAVCWLDYGVPARSHPVWHVWIDNAVVVVGNGDEQPLPSIDTEREVLVILRAKTSRHRLARCRAAVEVLPPWSRRWKAVLPALLAARLNLPDPAGAAERWAARSSVVRLVPLEVLESPGSLPTGSGAAAPVTSPATTVRRP
ncbi:MAG: hypothetical protein ACR2KL_10405 [Nocardioidaceae bacterium]